MVVGLKLAADHCCRPQAELVLLHFVLALADPRPPPEQQARPDWTSGILMPESVHKYRLRLIILVCLSLLWFHANNFNHVGKLFFCCFFGKIRNQNLTKPISCEGIEVTM